MTTVRFGFVGTSWITGAFIEAARTVVGVEVVAGTSRNPETARAFAEEHGIAQMHPDIAALGADPDVDAVYVASPNALHAEQSMAMLAAGKHVLVEKPLATTPDEATAMVAAARRADRVLMEAYVAPFEPNVAAMRDALPQLGTLRRAVLVKDQYSSRYDQLKAGALPNAFNPDLGGGSLMDIGFYPVALAVHLFGEPSSVLATGVLLPSGVDGHGSVLLGYDGFDVVCLHSKIAPGGIDSQIAGEDAVLTFDDCSVPGSVRLIHRLGSPGEPTLPGFTRSHPRSEEIAPGQDSRHMRYEIEEFAGLVERGAHDSAVHPLTNSLATLAILSSARETVGVRFPADT